VNITGKLFKRQMAKSDRQVERTRKRLQQALIELIGERGYDAITVQDIAARADVGRTTFYLHYSGKDDLFLSCHEAILRGFHAGPLNALSREELLAAEVPAGVVSAYRHLEAVWLRLYPVFQGKDGSLILRRMRDWNAQEIEASLQAAFGDAESSIALDLLANHLAGARITLLQWWLEKRRPHTAEEVAQAFHRLQRAVIRDAYGVGGDE
jgi:AcrR family transcriptional regulator